MKLAKALSALLVVGLSLTMGCVITTRHTIDAHVTVDIRYIEEHAASDLDFITGSTDSSSAGPRRNMPWSQRVWAALAPIRPVYAAEEESTSPLLEQIKTALKKRYPEIETLKKKGYAGESNRGYLELRPADDLKDPEKKNEVQKVIAAENKDRKALHNERARLDKETGVSVSTVEQVYAYERLKRAKPGQIFQLPPEGKYFDEFKKSDAGKALKDACKPDEWITIK